MCTERRRFSQTMASEWQTAFVVSHRMPWCALLTAVKNYNKSLEKLQEFSSRPRPRPRPNVKMMINTSNSNRTSCLIRLPWTTLRLDVGVMSGRAYLSGHVNIMRVVDNPYCKYCQGTYETAVHFACECDRCASLSQEIWESHTYSQMICNT